MPSHEGEQRLPVIVVASWYPGVDDPARGRFVADQVEALAATGRAAPMVASFDTALVDGSQVQRLTQSGLVQRHIAVAGASPMNRSAWGLEGGIPIARPSLLEGLGRATPSGSDADLRRDALVSLVESIGLGSGAKGVVHAHTAYPDGYAATGIAQALGWPLVITEHASFVARQLRQPAQRQRYHAAVAAAARFLAVSEVLAGELLKAIPALEGKLEVMPNAIPVHQYRPVGLDEREPEELLFVGYRKPTKGIGTLLRAFADVQAVRPGATLRLIGRSPTDGIEDGWRQLASDLGIAESVLFDPPLDRVGIARAMQRASLLVHGSPRETFGMTTLEALASGMPVVATRSGGISGILENSELGELAPPHDSRALARAILRALDRRTSFDPQRLREAVEPYASTNVADRLLRLYGEILDSAEPAGRFEAEAPPPARSTSILVVADDTARAETLLRDMPRELLETMVVVTRIPDEHHLPDGLRAVVSSREAVTRSLGRVGLRGPRGTAADRVRRVLTNPFSAISRRISSGGTGAVRWRATVGGIRETLDDSREVRDLLAGGSVTAICVDAVDHEAADPLIQSGRVTPAPGGLLWLADAWASRSSDAKAGEAHPRVARARSA